MAYPELLRTALDLRLTVARALELLRAGGASPAEAADALHEVTGCAPVEARRMVDASHAWSGPRTGMSLGGTRDWSGGVGQHGSSGHGAASVLPHLVRQAAQAGATRTPRR